MNEAHMKRALELASENVKNSSGGPFGSLIVQNDEIIAEGTNQVTSLHDPSAHAEIIAIRNACEKLKTFSLKGCEIYASCEPCPMCLAAIYWARLDKIYYSGTKIDAQIAGFDDDHIYRELAQLPGQRKIEMIRLLANQCFTPFDLWMKSDKKIPF